MTENELIEGLIRHDRNAFRELVGNHRKKVIKTAFYFTQNMEDAEELAQDIFMETIESIKHFRKSSSLSTWIYRITVNKSLNLVRKNKRKKIFSSLEDLFSKKSEAGVQDLREPSHSATKLEENERRALLSQSIRSLPENQRITFILSKYDGLSYKEIAEVMNISISSVESLLHRARLNLQKKLARHFSEYVKK
jgi:RNA polymerase sigma-70 factor (ECF subfamily)